MSYPAPILNLNFANAKQLVHPYVVLSRASQGSYFDGGGILSYANNGVPCFTHDPLTGVCEGLFLGPPVTFFDTYCEQLDNAAWTKTSCSVTANATVAPDGKVTADKLIENTESAVDHRLVSPSFTVTSGAQYTASYFIKAGERTSTMVLLTGVGGTARINFDLTNGTVSNAVCDSIWSTPVGAAIPVGNGWYRISVTSTPSASGSVASHVLIGTSAYTGDGTSGLYVWGAKIYAGTGPTSYLPTVASGVTRAADVCSVDLTKLTRNGSPMWNGLEGTIVVRGKFAPAPYASYAQSVFSLDAGSWENRVFVPRWPVGATNVSFVKNASAISDTSLGLTANSSDFSVAVAYDMLSASFVFNGVLYTKTFSSSFTSALNRLVIGSDGYPETNLGGTISSLKLYNRRIADAYLPDL